MSSPRDASGNWPKVRVNDQYYVLKESISDTSSSDDSDSEGSVKSTNRGGDHISSSSSSNSNSSKSSTSSDDSDGSADSPIKGESTKASSGPAGAGEVPVLKSKSPDYVPLRSQGTSGATDVTLGRKRSDSLAKETPERWRMRLWPSKAITAFCRIITRCKPPPSSPGLRIGGSRNDKLELLAHWRKTELSKVPTVFTDPAEHSGVFFLLSVEECREAVTKAEDPDAFVFEAASRFSKSAQHDHTGRNGWLDGEITSIVAESPSGALPKACDPRLGSVWVVAAAISPRTSTNSTAKHYQGGFHHKQGAVVGKEGLDLSGGDLMVLHSASWSHPLLGIIQPWDPDYDIKYGINFSINQSTYISTQQAPSRDGSKGPSVQVVNILVTVDMGDDENADIGGWASQGSIHPGVKFSMAPIGTS
jgi:hypothetical protein